MRKIRRKLLQTLANFIVNQIEQASTYETKLMWYNMGMNLDTYCIVSFKMYLD